MNLIEHITRQSAWSERTFGPGDRAEGVINHIEKELDEIRKDPKDLMEWIDIILLALDGAWRAGYTPEQIARALEAKHAKNESRKWPDWRTAAPGKAIEHIRTESGETEETRLFDRVRSIVAEQAGCSETVIDVTKNLGADLEMDSLDRVELCLAIEDEFSLIISDDDAEKCYTVGDVIALVQRLTSEAHQQRDQA